MKKTVEKEIYKILHEKKIVCEFCVKVGGNVAIWAKMRYNNSS